MITVKIGDTSFICETAEEAAKLHRLLQPAPAVPVQPTQVSGPTQSVLIPTGGVSASTPRTRVFVTLTSYKDFLKKLAPHVGGTVETDEMVKLVGAEHPNGVGPRLAALARRAAVDGISYDDYIQKDASVPGNTVWHVLKAM